MNIIEADDAEIGITGHGQHIGLRVIVAGEETRITVPSTRLQKLLVGLLACAENPNLAQQPPEGETAGTRHSTVALPILGHATSSEVFGDVIVLSLELPAHLVLTFQVSADAADQMAKSLSATAKKARRLKSNRRKQ